ncbi:hypothetical protein QP810_10030 [Streptococcus agalactiae]|uniref:hypothetical protein n=1 Tax=Streptococcus agalactiae TaxID=1311 RepID=UPI0025561FCD|nr:hypothetical protein [Streptococcus agalactiae]MDK8747562.1 hypothetical protein [Streptococcus agalactiae]
MDINLKETDIKKALRIMSSESGIDSLASLGRELGLKETTFRSSITNNSIRLKDFLKAAELMGYEVIVKKK